MIAVVIIPTAEAATIEITVPPIAANKAFFAVASLVGSPWAERNKMPVIIQKIITIPVATTHTNLATFATIPVIVMFACTCAKVIPGKTKTDTKKIKDNNFFCSPLS